MSPKDDRTSLGNILVDMGLITRDRLDEVVSEQQRATVEMLMGKLMIADGILSEEQLAQALEIQRGLRSKHKYERAMAMSEVASFTNSKLMELASVAKLRVETMRHECAVKRNGRK